jgi:hypothetical protein
MPFPISSQIIQRLHRLKNNQTTIHLTCMIIFLQVNQASPNLQRYNRPRQMRSICSIFDLLNYLYYIRFYQKV